MSSCPTLAQPNAPQFLFQFRNTCVAWIATLIVVTKTNRMVMKVSQLGFLVSSVMIALIVEDNSTYVWYEKVVWCKPL